MQKYFGLKSDGGAFSNAPRTIRYPNPTENGSELGPQLPFVSPKSSPKREKRPLGLCGNPVTFLLKPSQEIQNTAETCTADSAAVFRGA